MAVVDIAVIGGVVVPAIGGTPTVTVTPTAQFTGVVAWVPNDTTFQRFGTYTATITLTAEVGFEFAGVTEDFFTVAGATSVTNAVDSGVVTAVFPLIDLLARLTGAQALGYIASLSPDIQTRYANLCVLRGFEILSNGNLLHTAELELLMDSI